MSTGSWQNISVTWVEKANDKTYLADIRINIFGNTHVYNYCDILVTKYLDIPGTR